MISISRVAFNLGGLITNVLLPKMLTGGSWNLGAKTAFMLVSFTGKSHFFFLVLTYSGHFQRSHGYGAFFAFRKQRTVPSARSITCLKNPDFMLENGAKPRLMSLMMLFTVPVPSMLS